MIRFDETCFVWFGWRKLLSFFDGFVGVAEFVRSILLFELCMALLFALFLMPLLVVAG